MRRALRINTHETQRPRNERQGYHVSVWIKCLKQQRLLFECFNTSVKKTSDGVQVLLKAHTPTQQPSLYSLLSLMKINPSNNKNKRTHFGCSVEAEAVSLTNDLSNIPPEANRLY